MGRHCVSAYFYGKWEWGRDIAWAWLSSQSLQPIYGRLSDIFGRKFVLLGSLFIFMIGSLACALAQVRKTQ
jgi:MFS family permease